jgi:hypothetical protein
VGCVQSAQGRTLAIHKGFLVEVILSFITIKSKIISRVLTVLNDRMVPGV